VSTGVCNSCLHDYESICTKYWDGLPLMQKVKMLEACSRDGKLTLGELLAKLTAVEEMLRGG